MITPSEKLTVSTTNVFGALLSRRGFVQAGGALIASFGLTGARAMQSPGTSAGT